MITEPPGLPYGGEWRGHDGWRGLNRAIMKTWAFEPNGHEPRIFGDEDGRDFVLSTRLTGKSVRTGRPFDMAVLEYWRVEDGLITLIRPHYFDTREAARIDGSD